MICLQSCAIPIHAFVPFDGVMSCGVVGTSIFFCFSEHFYFVCILVCVLILLIWVNRVYEG